MIRAAARYVRDSRLRENPDGRKEAKIRRP